MAAGPKVRRRDLKEDKVYVTMAGVADFCVRNRLPIAFAVLVILAVFAGGYYLHIRSQTTAVDASWALYQTTHIELPSEKIAALNNVAAEYPKTPAGEFAEFEMANTLYDGGRYDEALQSFREFLKNNPHHLLAPAAIEAIGYCQESLGQWQEAIDTYKKLIKDRPESPAAARANYRLGLCYENIGDKEKAIEAYETTVELLPDSLWAQYANGRLDALRPHAPSTDESMEVEMAPGGEVPPAGK